MYKNTNNPVAIRTQNEIGNALLLLIKEREYNQITITDICKRAEIVRKTFYNNFDSKDDIMNFLINNIFLELEQKIDVEYMNVRRMLLIVFNFIMKYREDLLLFYKRGLLRFAYKNITTHITKEYILARLDKTMIDEKAHKYITANISSTLICVIETWIENDFAESVEYLAELTEFLINKPKVIDRNN